MKTKRLISLLLAAVFALSAAATPALAASTGSELPDRTAAGVDENNSVVSIRLTADGDLQMRRITRSLEDIKHSSANSATVTIAL